MSVEVTADDVDGEVDETHGNRPPRLKKDSARDIPRHNKDPFYSE
jgi:hypothetical protein